MEVDDPAGPYKQDEVLGDLLEDQALEWELATQEIQHAVLCNPRYF